MKYFIDAQGKYIGGFGGGAKPLVDAFEIANPPEHGADIWTGSAWDTSLRPVPKDTPEQAAIKLLAAELPTAKRDAVLAELEAK